MSKIESRERRKPSPHEHQFVHYQIELASSIEHLFRVVMNASVTPTKSIDLSLPAWIPGSYMIRDFSRNIHDLKSKSDGIQITYKDKQTWTISSTDDKEVDTFSLEYHVYANDLSVRSAFIDEQYAFFNGTSVFMQISDHRDIEHLVSIETDANNKTEIASSLLSKRIEQSHFLHKRFVQNKQSLSINTFSCCGYDDLIEHPVLMGAMTKHSIKVKNIDFHFVFSGDYPVDITKIAADLSPVIEHHIELFGEFPESEYWFITLLCDNGFGGLEHTSSTVLQYSRFELPLIDPQQLATNTDIKERSYQQFLSLCSHELFHTWHVKRIKPEILYRPDLSQEVYTPQMWIYEGFTSFYDDLALARTKTMTSKAYLDVLNENITRLLKNPGRNKQSVAQSSFEAWNKFYKQDAGSINRIVSYYNKGAVVALCLDIMLRQQSNNQRSLDDVMRQLWNDYGKQNIGTPDLVIQTICKDKLGINLDSFIHMASESTMDLPLPTLLQSIGLSLTVRPSTGSTDKGGKASTSIPHYDLGAQLTTVNGSLKVSQVLQERAASIAGMQVNDVIIALDGWQVDEKKFHQVLKSRKIDDTLSIHIMRDGRLLELQFTIYPAINDTARVQVQDEALFNGWLGLETKA